ncbi:MAG: hypothetical protein BGO77_02675 [Caedibacter sp. 37-49]|nr:MAG: hypothetical protein BGO77_02675 [Caedibacter sp. 37-49]
MGKYNLRLIAGLFLLSSIQGISSSEVVNEDERYQRILKITPPQQRTTENQVKPSQLKTTDHFKKKQFYTDGERVAYTDIAPQNPGETKSH